MYVERQYDVRKSVIIKERRSAQAFVYEHFYKVRRSAQMFVYEHLVST